MKVGAHLRRLVHEYVTYHHEDRTPQMNRERGPAMPHAA